MRKELYLLATLALCLVWISDSDAGPFRRGARATGSCASGQCGTDSGSAAAYGYQPVTYSFTPVQYQAVQTQAWTQGVEFGQYAEKAPAFRERVPILRRRR